MSTPRLEINLDQIRHNATVLVDRLARRGISVTGVTKATLGSARVAREFIGAGVTAIGDSRIENIERMRAAGVHAEIVLVRSPMLSQCDRVVAHADISMNTELDVLSGLSDAATRAGRAHQVILMVELGDLREGIMPGDLLAIAERARQFPLLTIVGIGANQACQSGSTPDEHAMAELSALVLTVESNLGIALPIVSGGNSANLTWALGAGAIGRVNNLRL
ncbi:MAG: alanine racemase, partial [Acidimicrobiia bacterium]|nr:alanine racemase [Acidimicrobiia bacterium]